MNSHRRFHIIVICTGNICRSPMAEGVLKYSLSPRTLSRAHISSAGVGAVPGLPATHHSVTACAENGIEISGHRSTPLTRTLIEEADLILTMEEHHREAAQQLSSPNNHVYLLARYGAGETPGEATGIPDPLGGDLEHYRATYAQIREQVLRAVPRIEREILSKTVES